jgi:hypothetical protein
MFRVSGIQIDPTILLPAGVTSIKRTSGGRHQLEVHHWFTVPIDLEVDCVCSVGLLTSASGASWTKAVSPIPKSAVTPPTPPGSGFMVHEPVSKAPAAGSGTESVSCNRVRYRYSGAPGWNPYNHPTSGNAANVSVT